MNTCKVCGNAIQECECCCTIDLHETRKRDDRWWYAQPLRGTMAKAIGRTLIKQIEYRNCSRCNSTLARLSQLKGTN
jgi:hypothetical protein